MYPQTLHQAGGSWVVTSRAAWRFSDTRCSKCFQRGSSRGRLFGYPACGDCGAVAFLSSGVQCHQSSWDALPGLAEVNCWVSRGRQVVWMRLVGSLTTMCLAAGNTGSGGESATSGRNRNGIAQSSPCPSYTPFHSWHTRELQLKPRQARVSQPPPTCCPREFTSE